MKRIELVRMILDDLAHGEKHSTIGLIHWLTVDLGYPVERVLLIAKRILKIPYATGEKTIREIEKHQTRR